MLLHKLLISAGISALSSNRAVAFVSPSSLPACRRIEGLTKVHNYYLQTTKKSPLCRRVQSTTKLSESSEDDIDTDQIIENSATSCWNPNLRKQLVAISSIGILETAYLTYDKIQYTSSKTSSSLIGALCSDSGGASSCNDVLHGPYASLHLGTIDIPLSTLGMAAYTLIFVLAISPLLFADESNGNGEAGVVDGGNRIALLGGTALMASFSIYLVSLILGVLHASCLFCFASAGLSITMAGLSWFGGMLPESSELSEEVMELRKKGLTVGASSVAISTVLALGLFLGVSDGSSGNFDSISASSSTPANSGTLLASTSTKDFRDNIPPPITAKSSASALTLASDLKALDSRMFGAFWCSHCYDQKQAFGLEAFASIPYIECDKEGYHNKREMCRERDVPGYPTWEINGELFPGERSLDELQEIVDDVKADK